MISETERLVLRRQSHRAGVGTFIQNGLVDYVYYVCKLRGLSAFSGKRDSLLRCVSGVGEAGASYMNK